jgi:hypothetical protein
MGCGLVQSRVESTQERKPTQSQPAPQTGDGGPKNSESDSELSNRLKDANLNGVWIADRCMISSSDGSGDDDLESEATDYSSQSMITISDEVYSLGVTTFWDNRCGKPKFTTHIQGIVHSKVSSKNRPDAVEIQLTKLKRLFEIRDEYYVDIFNRMEYCGKSDWKVNAPQEIPQNTPDCEHPILPALMTLTARQIANSKLELQFDQNQAEQFTKR